MNVSNRTTRAELERALLDLARNYRWAWDRATFKVLDRVRAVADAPQGHPMTIVPLLDDTDWAAIMADRDLIDAINVVHADLQQCLDVRRHPIIQIPCRQCARSASGTGGR